MKKVLFHLKPYLRWIILGGTAFFLVKTLKNHWQEVIQVRISELGATYLAIAFLITIIALVWSGVVWFFIIKEFNQTVDLRWAIREYALTNIAKYLPGNIWHFYGRVAAIKEVGVSIEIATITVLIEPLLMAAGALVVALFDIKPEYLLFQLFCLFFVLLIVHPIILNPVIQYLVKLRLQDLVKLQLPGKSFNENTLTELKLDHYLLKPFLGNICFVLLRASGFLLIILAFNPIQLNQVLPIISVFSWAWLLGLVVPGAPGGVGVFEATVLTLLEHEFSPSILLSVVAFYRLITVLTETFVAGFAWLDKRIFNQ
ncbi:MAG: UPF0104 family protein [Trichodesmium sp.]